MSRKYPAPWFRHSRGLWYVTIDGRQFNLGPDEQAAFEEYHRLMSATSEQRLIGESVAEILDAFLEWCHIHRSPRTFEWYRDRAQQFLDFIPKGLKVSQLKPFHLQRWIDSYATLWHVHTFYPHQSE